MSEQTKSDERPSGLLWKTGKVKTCIECGGMHTLAGDYCGTCSKFLHE